MHSPVRQTSPDGQQLAWFDMFLSHQTLTWLLLHTDEGLQAFHKLVTCRSCQPFMNSNFDRRGLGLHRTHRPLTLYGPWSQFKVYLFLMEFPFT